MDKIYGFKQDDVKKFIKYLDRRNGQPLTQVFSDYAKSHGKSKGTVRNMYYAVARRSQEDKDFSDKYLGGRQISVQKVAEFNADEERSLIKSVLEGKKTGKSVRSVINEMACGDKKLALRYQNKYRNALKSKQTLIAEVAEEINAKTGENTPYEATAATQEMQIKRLQNEINGLLDRLTGKLKKENEYLRIRLNKVEIENLRLRKALYGDDSGKTAEYFKKQTDKTVLS